MPFLSYLHKVMDRESLSSLEAMAAMEEILEGRASTAQIAAFLAAMRVKGETADELLGLAQAMRDHSVRVEHGIRDRAVLDTCGTGGDQSGTFNVSTAVAFVASACGVAVAKHGNRSMSSRCGSADVVEALGARLLTDAAQMARCIRETGIGFLFAPALHPAMKHAAPARAELKTRTVMNLLGPLTNPAGATAQLVGAPSLRAAELMAVTLASLGLERGYVVHGEDGLDEVSTTAPTHLMGIVHGAIEHEVVEPERFGVKRARLEELQGGDAQENARIILEVLGGHHGARRDIVLVNAAVALRAAGAAATFEEGMQRAAEAIDSGAARAKLHEFVEYTQRAGADPA
jgi:anthranilate phosphoribosyltransferase